MKASEWKKLAATRPRFGLMAHVDDNGYLQIEGDQPRNAPEGWNLDAPTAVLFGQWLLETFEEKKDAST